MRGIRAYDVLQKSLQPKSGESDRRLQEHLATNTWGIEADHRVKITTRSLRSRRASEETEETIAISVESGISVMGEGEVNNLHLRSVNGGEQKEEDLSRRILEILDRLDRLELETNKRS